jgi:Peroxiredoxin
MKQTALFLTLVLAAISLFTSSTVNAQSPKIGSVIDNFTLSDTDGKSLSLDNLKGKNGAVVIFLSAQCPVVRGYHERINKIAADYQSKGINFIGINANASESPDSVKSNIAEYEYKFPVLIDKGNVLADKLGATVTPEVYYLDTKNILLYHGAIDNDRSGRNVSENFLQTAFDASLNGKKIERTTANAFGCSIKRVGDQ